MQLITDRTTQFTAERIDAGEQAATTRWRFTGGTGARVYPRGVGCGKTPGGDGSPLTRT